MITIKEAIRHLLEEKLEGERTAKEKQELSQMVEWLNELEFRRKRADLLENSDVDITYTFDDGRCLKAGQRYRHFKKGNIYIVVIPCVYDTDDMKEYVIYRGGDNKRRMWARPVDEFMSEVDRNKYPHIAQKYRFELIEDENEI